MTGLHRAALLTRVGSLLKTNQFVQARNICLELVAQNKSDINALELLAQIESSQGRHEESIALIKKCVAIKPREPHFHIVLGGRFMNLGRYDEAVASFQKALKFAPNHPEAIVGVAETLEKKGDRAEARAILEPFVSAGIETVYMAKTYALVELADGDPKKAAAVLERHGGNPMPVACIFTLAKAHEKSGNADRAFELYTIANKATAIPFDIDAYTRDIDDIIAAFSPQALSRMPRAQTKSETAIFVTGRPRSGTTLVASIIGAHPDAYDAGELATLHELIKHIGFSIGSTLIYPKVMRDVDQADANLLSQQYLDEVNKLGNGAPRVIDKSLGTFMHLGLVQTILPNAKVINCRRNPIDNCLACFTENLNTNHTYTSDLRNLGASYVQYERIMAHWIEVLDLPILNIDYEVLVENQEAVTRQIIDFVGLPWNDQCLRFHEDSGEKRTTKAALTLSYDQVRRPIYKTSVGRAKKFEKHLGPLIEELAKGGLIEPPQQNTEADKPAA